MSQSLVIRAIEGLPLIRAGDKLAELIAMALVDNGVTMEDGDILVIAQKIVSKAEGRIVDLREIQPGEKAIKMAATVNKDPRLVEVILAESRSVVRQVPGVLLTEHRCGWIMANAGIDASNVAGDNDNSVLLLPLDPDKSSRQLHAHFRERQGVDVGIVISDSFGRPWRLGTTGVAIGAAGVPSLWDRRGERDLFGRELMVSQQGIADELAAAASLLQGQGAEGRPVVHIRGFNPDPENPPPARPAADLIRPANEDMFR